MTTHFAVPPSSEALAQPSVQVSTLSAVAVRQGVARVASSAAAVVSRVLWVLDVTAAAAAMLLAHAVSPSVSGSWRTQAVTPTAAYAVAFLLIAYGAGFYDLRSPAVPRALLVRTFVVAVLATAATLAFFYLAYYRPLGRWVVLGAAAFSVPLVLLPHSVVWWVVRRRPRRVLFTGRGPLVSKLAHAIEVQVGPLYQVVGAPLPERVDVDGLVALCRAEGVDDIVLSEHSGDADWMLVPALHCLPLGCRIRGEADFYEDLFSAVPVQHVSADWMLTRGLDTSNPVVESLKRLTDVVLAVVVLALSAPVLAMAALAIVLAGDGPVLYAQTRCGRYGRPFRIWKLRTMRVGAEEGEVRWATERDPRCTLLGRFLRRLRIDEVPQIANILWGEMSFVGPRPERPEFVEPLERLIPFYGWRHFVRPGLTGWAQINLPYGSGVEDARRKLEYDLHYIRHHSLIRDLSIVLRTTAAVLRGAR
jgi:exopolysaccharide biosynthesis polyprenyl glycosylphosphotransferase